MDITPEDLSGLVSVWAQSLDGVHDPIYARAVVQPRAGDLDSRARSPTWRNATITGFRWDPAMGMLEELPDC